MRTRLLILCFALIALAPAHVAADTLLTFQYDSSGLPAVSKPGTSERRRVWIGEGTCRIDRPSKSMIYVEKAKRVLILDHDLSVVNDLSAPVSFFDYIPANAVPAVKQQLAEMFSATDVKARDETTKIKDLESRRYTATIDNLRGKLIEIDMWRSDAIGVDVSPCRKLEHELAALQPANMEWLRELNALKGIALRSRTVKSTKTGDETETIELVSVSVQDAPAGLYAAPEAYEEQAWTPIISGSP